MNDVTQREHMLDETFLVESINVNMTQVVKIRPIVNSPGNLTFCSGMQSCIVCTELVNNGDIRRIKEDQEHYAEECARLCSVDISSEVSHDVIMKDKISENPLLSKEQKAKLFGVLKKNRRVFSNKLGKCTTYVHWFDVTDKSPFKHKCRSIPTALIDKVNDTIQQMLKDGVIEKANSRYINPLCIVVKKDGAVHLTIDARTLNKRRVPNHYRTECIDGLLERVNGAKFFSIIDLSSSFWQMELSEDCKDFTAFLHNGKQYRFNRAPFGHN